MQTTAIISPEVAALGLDKVNLIVRTLITFDLYLKNEGSMETDTELEWPSDYGWLHFIIIKSNLGTPEAERLIRVSFKHEDLYRI